MQYSRRFIRGFSLQEVLISMTILLVLVGLITGYIFQVARTNELMRLESQLKTASQISMTQLGAELAQAKKLYEKNTLGDALIAKINFGQAPQPIANTRLPYIQFNGSLSPERNCSNPIDYFVPNAVGNSLAFVQLVGSFDKFPNSVSVKRSIDLYRFHYVYISDTQGSNQRTFIDYWGSANRRPTQQLVEWRSTVYADYNQLNYYLNTTTDNTQKASILTALKTAGYKRAWDHSQNNLDNAFYNLGTSSTTAYTTSDNYKLEYGQFINLTRLSNENNTLYSVSYNTEMDKSSANYFPAKQRVPAFYRAVPSPECPAAIPTPSATPVVNAQNFPRGFEVMIVGPTSGRKVLLHLTLVAKGNTPSLTTYPETVIVTAKDM